MKLYKVTLHDGTVESIHAISEFDLSESYRIFDTGKPQEIAIELKKIKDMKIEERVAPQATFVPFVMDSVSEDTEV